MIRSYGDKDTERFAQGQRVRRFASFERIAQRKLIVLEAATTLSDLRLPGLRLESLRGSLAGVYSIRINDQWRITFEWVENRAERVRIEDYH
jgi:proteic killer suppression protein